jgi:hypothetical protein
LLEKVLGLYKKWYLGLGVAPESPIDTTYRAT